MTPIVTSIGVPSTRLHRISSLTVVSGVTVSKSFRSFSRFSSRTISRTRLPIRSVTPKPNILQNVSFALMIVPLRLVRRMPSPVDSTMRRKRNSETSNAARVCWRRSAMALNSDARMPTSPYALSVATRASVSPAAKRFITAAMSVIGRVTNRRARRYSATIITRTAIVDTITWRSPNIWSDSASMMPSVTAEIPDTTRTRAAMVRGDLGCILVSNGYEWATTS